MSSPMYRVLITGAIHQTGIDLLKQEPDLDVDYRPDLPIDEVISIIEPYHCIISRSETPIQKELMDKATNLQVISRAAVGIANIDVNYATQKGILVINTPAKNTNSAAELTFALLLDSIRKVTEAHKNMQRGDWNRHKFKGTELQGKTIGIIGLGNVGHRVAKFAHGFDMKVLSYDPYITDDVFGQNRAKRVDLDQLVRESDVITVHTPKTPETVKMIGPEEFAKMKEGVVILNAARGGIIDEKALLQEIQSGKVLAAGIDTWEVEPPVDNPFKDLTQVVMTPHIGASTSEAQLRIAETVADQVPRALRGEIVDSPINMPKIKIMENSIVSCYSVLAERLGSFASQFIDFNPSYLEIKYRGSLAKEDCSIIRLALLKGLFKKSHEVVNFVNADQIATSTGLHINSIEDPSFKDYDSAIKITLRCQDHEFKIGGVVFHGDHMRLTLIDDFVFEVKPSGYILVTKNKDRPGMVGVQGMILGDHEVNIGQYDLSRNLKGGEAMSVVCIDENFSDEVLQELRDHEGIVLAKKIFI